MAIEVTPANTSAFSQIHEQYKPGLFGRGENAHVRGRATDGGAREVYTHHPLMPNGRGAEALERRLGKYAEGARLVKDAMTAEYGAEVANAVFTRVSRETGRDLNRDVRRGDLGRLKAAADETRAALARERAATEAANSRLPVADRAAVTEHYASRWRHDGAMAAADRTRLPTGVALGLPTPFVRDFIERGNLRYAEGTLRVDRDVDPAQDDDVRERDNLVAVATFIRERFGHDPGTPGFDHVARNLFRYMEQGTFIEANKDVLRASEGTARLGAEGRTDGITARFELSVRAEQVHMIATVSGPCSRSSPEARAEIAGAIYRRRDELLIDARRVSTAEFDPAASQLDARQTLTLTHSAGGAA